MTLFVFQLFLKDNYFGLLKLWSESLDKLTNVAPEKPCPAVQLGAGSVAGEYDPEEPQFHPTLGFRDWCYFDVDCHRVFDELEAERSRFQYHKGRSHGLVRKVVRPYMEPQFIE